jgi:hypothetical protein
MRKAPDVYSISFLDLWPLSLLSLEACYNWLEGFDCILSVVRFRKSYTPDESESGQTDRTMSGGSQTCPVKADESGSGNV